MRLVDALPNTPKGRAIASQLVRSGTSVAALDDDHRRDTQDEAEEEADETALWLELITDDKLLPEKKVAPLLKEANEVTAIMAASYISASRGNRDGSGKSAISNQKSAIRP